MPEQQIAASIAPTPDPCAKKGMYAALFAFLMWGSLPLFWRLLDSVPAHEIICHRIIWSFVAITIFLVATRQVGSTLAALRNKKTLALLCVTSITLTANWFLFIWAINAHRVLETSLGYFINPLLNILIGVLVFRDRASFAGWVAIALAACGIFYQVYAIGHVPLISLSLAVTFTIYGVLRKIVVIEAMPGLFVETTIVTPFALGYVIWQASLGHSAFTFATGGAALYMDFLLIMAGIVTSMPLALYTYAARHIPLSTLGIMQYGSPSLTFLLGIFVFNEPFSIEKFITFACIWAALIIYTTDSYLSYSRTKKMLQKGHKSETQVTTPSKR